MKFEELELIQPILDAIKEKKYTDTTEIQAKAIPVVLEGNDVLGSAQTGTGKTAAFAIPILQNLFYKKRENNRYNKINALVLTPTRELAIQVAESFNDYGKYTGIKTIAIFGGVPQNAQVKKIENGIDILVATPGRLLDLIDQGYIHLKNIEYFVLDEADRMLDMGFINDIKKILPLLPKDRQSLFFSATLPDHILQLSRKIVNSPIKIEASPRSSTAKTVKQYVYYTNKDKKRELLVHIIENIHIDQAILFCRTKYGSDKLVKFLKKENISAVAIHGDKSQHQRQKALTSFKKGEVKILAATDIAARGIDINELKFVINYDIPNEPEAYVHRIGRTGRAGEEGTAISICEPENNEFIVDIEKLIGQSIEIASENPYLQTDLPMTPREKKEDNAMKIEHRKNISANRRKNLEAKKTEKSDFYSKTRGSLKNAAKKNRAKKKEGNGQSGYAAKRKKDTYKKKFGK